MLKYLFFDIDDALTDGYISICTDRRGSKNYFRKDLAALAEVRNLGIAVIGINAVDDLCDHYLKDFGAVDQILVGEDKVKLVNNLLGYDRDPQQELAYIGTDINLLKSFDSPLNTRACPNGSEKLVYLHSDFHCDKKAGHGAISEFCENIIKVEHYNRFG